MSIHEPTIVVAVDFDEPSKRAVALAIDFAHRLRGRVVLVHVVPPNNFPEGTRLLPTDASDPVDLGEYVSARARRMMNEYFVELLASGVEVRQEVRTGHVVEAVLRAIEECGASFLTVGTHGRKGGTRFVLGSVAEALARRCPIPVLITRHESEEDGERHDRSFTKTAMASGAVAGVATGAIGGPVGAIVGGAIGGVVGGIIGKVVTREGVRADIHDRELDEVIGVTSGSLGTPAATKHPTPEVIRDATDKD